MSEGEETWNQVGREEDSKKKKKKHSNSSDEGAREEFHVTIWDLRPAAGYRFKARVRTIFGWSPGGLPSDVYNTARRF